MRQRAFLLPILALLAILPPAPALALDSARGGGATLQRGGGLARPGLATPFGGAYSASQNGKRAQDLQRPSSTICALRSQTRSVAPRSHQDAAGKVHLFNDPSTLKGRNGDIYGNCGDSVARIRPRSTGKPASVYNARTNTLTAASDGYVNRSASSSMMPKKLPSMYDPATGVIRSAKRPDAYQVYQR